jgi:hypothetical protein
MTKPVTTETMEHMPPLKLYFPSVFVFGIGCAFHLTLIYKHNLHNIRPFGIGWGTLCAMLIAPRPLVHYKVEKVSADVRPPEQAD